MKLLILFGALLIFASSTVGATPTPFIERINAHWKSRRDDQILADATIEATKSPSTPEALVVLFGYHLFIAGNYEQAISSLDRLMETITADKPAVEAVEEYRKQVLQQAASGLSPVSEKQLDELHKLFREEFPVKALLILVTPP